MKQRSEDKEINNEDPEFSYEAMDLQRAELAHQILSCKPYSWSLEESLTQKFLLSEANQNI